MKKTNLIIVTDTNEFLCQLTTEVHNALQTGLKDLRKPEKQNSVEYLTRDDVVSLLHISFSTLNRMINKGVLKAYKLGRRTLFRSTDVELVLIKINTKGENYAY